MNKPADSSNKERKRRPYQRFSAQMKETILRIVNENQDKPLGDAIQLAASAIGVDKDKVMVQYQKLRKIHEKKMSEKREEEREIVQEENRAKTLKEVVEVLLRLNINFEVNDGDLLVKETTLEFE